MGFHRDTKLNNSGGQDKSSLRTLVSFDETCDGDWKPTPMSSIPDSEGHASFDQSGDVHSSSDRTCTNPRLQAEIRLGFEQINRGESITIHSKDEFLSLVRGKR
ncbi:hypothetical protein OKA04_23645 [Luteolibacter flavescens]|uniref:Uncharacterized protein n=1 Tax=Luteolibacter flavescens TaxID=1859460 RepID=A0ABT3FWG7_9BACT|nr:hypothetical protein [Luteolibacter flavescens]MCW1887752.1 hypothetical protein [Luteolibacter flavescens]